MQAKIDQTTHVPLPYDPETLPRELLRHYIGASEADIVEMLNFVGAGRLDDLFSHIPEEILFHEPPSLPQELEYKELQNHMEALASRNRCCESFIGDGLPDFEVHPIVPYVSGIRNLTTAYTPYQPERSQGTLMSHWIYQCMMSALTGFEAINSSLYDRSTALYEAICVALRLKKKTDTAIIPQALYPGDMEVLKTMAEGSRVRLVSTPMDEATGRIDIDSLKATIVELGDRLAAVVFPQVNSMGILEDVDALADLCRETGACSIAVIDPMLLGAGGLKPPVNFGRDGVDMIVGEGQHLAIAPNFGGPGLGIFGIRWNDKTRNHVRSTPGRYVGKALDFAGRDCHVMVLSTREQHIRKEKATSNICSNQAFLATLAGAAIIARGESGMAHVCRKAREQALDAFNRLTSISGISAAYPEAPFFNEFVLTLPRPSAEAISLGRKSGLHIGVDVSDRSGAGQRHLLKVSFSDRDHDIERLAAFFETLSDGTAQDSIPVAPEIPDDLLREGAVGLPEIPEAEIRTYYDKLGDLNVSPDAACYPLGSCTMKYNPYINDWAANLPGFTDIHPQAPIEDAQGCLEVLYTIQEWFKTITGLAAVTTQPVAGAQGELVGLKLIKAYHSSRGEANRNILFIPKTAHGTNFASAAMAGFENQIHDGAEAGIVLLEADENGEIDIEDFSRKLDQYGSRLSGIMVTNPNTSGIFETDFKLIAGKVHHAGGLVYMDGANMNAIAGWVNLAEMGVDAVHANLHKTWSIPHGGGGPGDAIVAVSEKLVDFLPGQIIEKENGQYRPVTPSKSIGSFHRHWGNFAHKVRCYTYLMRLGQKGIRRMSAMAVLSSRYLFEKLRGDYLTLPLGSGNEPRMHEFIITLDGTDFYRLEKAGVSKAAAIPRVGKLFLDFGFHAPTVAWPEVFGLMIEPTESYSMAELDRFAEAVMAIRKLILENPEALARTPCFTPVDRIDETAANRQLCLFEPLESLPPINENRLDPGEMASLSIAEIYEKILAACK